MTTPHAAMPARPPYAAMPAPTPAGRALAPDVARGLMLLGIALANVVAWLYGRETGLLMRPLDGGPLDRAVDAACALFVDNRGYPMFAFLFAYGIHQLATRELGRGRTRGRVFGLLATRYAWLLLFGLAHGFLLFFGDIMSLYAVAALMLLIWLQAAPTWALWTVFGVTLPFFCFVSLGDAGAMAWEGMEGMEGVSFAFPSISAATYLDSLAARAGEDFGPAVLWLPWDAICLLPPMVLGLILARTRVLERPWERPVLARTLAIVGVCLAVLGGLPLAWGLLAGAEASPLWMLAAMLSNVTGIAAGVGIPCLIALAVSRVQRRRMADPWASAGPIASALAALGKRSMSGYLAQSALFSLVMPAWTLRLGATLGTAAASGIAIAVWLVTVIAAVLLERAGKPGPAEWLHRKLVALSFPASDSSPAPTPGHPTPSRQVAPPPAVL